jgi:hypothetical protein
MEMKIRTYVELYIEVEADYSPERPAPPCQNHDSPRFSDPGDSEECEIKSVKFLISRRAQKDKFADVPDSMMEYVVNACIDDIIGKCREEYESEIDDIYANTGEI